MSARPARSEDRRGVDRASAETATGSARDVLLPRPTPLDARATRSSGTGRRRPTWVLLGALLVGLASLLGAWILTRVDQRVAVLVAARDLDVGTPLGITDLRVVEIGSTDQVRAIRPSQQDLVLGRAPRGPIPAGTVLNTDLFTGRGQVVPPGMVVVSSALDPGAAPAGLRAGDPVRLFVAVRVAGGQTAAGDAAVLGDGTVWAIDRDNAAGTKVTVSVLVPADLQQRAVQAAYEGTLRLSLTAGTG